LRLLLSSWKRRHEAGEMRPFFHVLVFDDTQPSYTMASVRVCPVERALVNKHFVCAHRIFEAAAPGFVPAQFPQNLSELAKFPHLSRKRELLKCFVYMRNACKLLSGAIDTVELGFESPRAYHIFQ
jgi:hypothetical protein